MAFLTTHQFSLGNLPFFGEYNLQVEPWRGGFAESQRPMPDSMHYVDHFKKGYYDFALLHIDQQSIWDPANNDRISKGRLFFEVKKHLQEVEPDLPIIVINHHTPHHDKYSTTETVEKIKKLTEGCHMICNSYEAKKQWGWGNVITHGLDTNDWGYDVDIFNDTEKKVESTKEPRLVIVQSPAGMEVAYRRIFLTEVIRRLEERKVPVTWVGVNIKFHTWDEYRDYVARSLVFLHGTWQSPRPRSRTEAMLSGSCVITTPYHDADTFIKSGTFKDNKVTYNEETNGFLTSENPIKDPRVMDNPDYTADLIEHLIFERPDIALQVGQQGKEFAQKEFTAKKFEDQWRALLTRLEIL